MTFQEAGAGGDSDGGGGDEEEVYKLDGDGDY
jgi:hypothetical protein